MLIVMLLSVKEGRAGDTGRNGAASLHGTMTRLAAFLLLRLVVRQEETISIMLSIEEQIKKAMAEGMFDDLPGKGKPIDLDGYFQTPEHLRICYSILKNGNFVPEEVQKLKEVEALRETLATCSDETQKKALTREINEKMMSVTLAMERLRREK